MGQATTTIAVEANPALVISTIDDGTDECWRQRVVTLEDSVSALQGQLMAAHATVATLHSAMATLAHRLSLVEDNSVLQFDGILRRQHIDGRDTALFSGVNVQVVNGEGASGAPTNGVGNLILGYNERPSLGPFDAGRDRGGSHNLVIGPEHRFASFGGLVAGLRNTVSAPAASVSGGENNTASGAKAMVAGGLGNTADGEASSVAGGKDNVASGLTASVSGGESNGAAGRSSSISGGFGNNISGVAAAIGGGLNRAASGQFHWRAGRLLEER